MKSITNVPWIQLPDPRDRQKARLEFLQGNQAWMTMDEESVFQEWLHQAEQGAVLDPVQDSDLADLRRRVYRRRKKFGMF